jgi:hypothetical protein
MEIPPINVQLQVQQQLNAATIIETPTRTNFFRITRRPGRDFENFYSKGEG